MLTKEKKREIVNNLTADLKKAKSAVFSDFQGLSASDEQNLRARLREKGISHKVARITLMRMAMTRAGLDAAAFESRVPTSVSYSFDDEVAPAKALHDFAREHEQLKILAGILDGKLIDGSQVSALAAIPGKEQLLAAVVGSLAAPMRGLVSALSGNMRQLVYALNAIKEYKNT